MSTTSVPPVEGEKLSVIQRIINIFVAPSKTFRDLNRNPSWWPAWLLIAVFGLIFIFAMDKQVGFEQVANNEISASPKTVERMEKLAPEQRAQQMQISVTFTKVFSYGFPITMLIIASIIAAVLMASFNFGLGTEIKFGMALAVVLWAWVPGILKSLLAAITLFAGADPEGFNVSNPVATNLAWLFNRTDHPVLYTAGSYIDIFAIWYIILMGIGFSCVSKAKRSSATWLVAGWYIVIAVLGVGWKAFFG